jgi:hypothetical protein
MEGVLCDQFPKQVLPYYGLSAALKCGVFFCIGLAFAPEGPSTGRLILGALVCGAIVFLTEYFWFYRWEMRLHREMSQEYGVEYERTLAAEISEKGLARIVASHWIVLKHKELMAKS